MKRLYIIIISFLLIGFSNPVQANQWQIDPDHSEVGFKIQHIYSFVSGRFTDFTGDVVFDPENLDKARFDFSVKVKSVHTFNNKRDNHLRSKDFFHADKFPVMQFKSSKMTLIKNNVYALEGMMTIKDVTHPVTMEFSYEGPKQHPFDDKSLVAGFGTDFSLDRLDYHVGNGKFLDLGIVGNIVKIHISIEALRKK